MQMDGTGRYMLPFGVKGVMERKEQHLISCLSRRVVACAIKVTGGRYPMHILQKVHSALDLCGALFFFHR
jgi:hypothetical protein